jgi:LacI family transcriptional regulator
MKIPKFQLTECSKNSGEQSVLACLQIKILVADSKGLDHFKELLKRKIPLIFFDQVLEHPDCTRFVLDNKKAGFDATKHLIEQVCKRIAHIEGNTKRNVYADRLAGISKL